MLVVWIRLQEGQFYHGCLQFFGSHNDMDNGSRLGEFSFNVAGTDGHIKGWRVGS